MLETTLSQMHFNLTRAGFHSFYWYKDAPLESLASRLGMPISSVPGRPTVDVLVPKTREDSPSGTLSSMHGAEAFPFHTETAHWRDPVDWVILRCVNPGSGSRPTLLIDGWGLALTKPDTEQLSQSLMVVKSGSKSFLAPLITLKGERLSFRHDPGCMRPASKIDKAAVGILEHALANAPQVTVQWKAGHCLVFDNHRLLHSRGVSAIADTDRQLERIYVIRKGN